MKMLLMLLLPFSFIFRLFANPSLSILSGKYCGVCLMGRRVYLVRGCQCLFLVVPGFIPVKNRFSVFVLFFLSVL